MLYDPKKSAAYNRQRVAIVIAHELAHQWFGNLGRSLEQPHPPHLVLSMQITLSVTMEWWSDLWLKEGFASYLEYVAVDAVSFKFDRGKFAYLVDLYFIHYLLRCFRHSIRPVKKPQTVEANSAVVWADRIPFKKL